MAARREVDVESLLRGERRSLARAITLTESSREDHREQAQALLDAALPHAGKSLRIGISGPPGAGKSTFIESFGLQAIAADRRVAVLAVDPTSPIGGGSILGDKTRMEQLARSPQAFIRPSPSQQAFGGVAEKTRECVLLCEAAGFDLILIETVGVGQSEYEVSSMVDFFLALIPPNAGDELQGIKRGIMELLDAIVVNKADEGNEQAAERTQAQYRSALRLLRAGSDREPQVLCCSALTGHGVDAVRSMIDDYEQAAKNSGALDRRRAEQNSRWLQQLTREEMQRQLRRRLGEDGLIEELESAVADGRISPLRAIARIREKLGT